MPGTVNPGRPAVLWLVRHGQTDWNLEGRYQGQADPPLNAVGQAEALRAAGELARPEVKQLDALFSSDLLRAVQTAERISAATGLTYRLDARLREVDLGEWEGVLSTEIKQLYPVEMAARRLDPLDHRPPGGETLKEVAQRVFQAADEMAAQFPGGQVVIVSHGLALAALIARAQGADLGRAFDFIPPNAIPQRVTWPPDGAQAGQACYG